MPGMSTHTADNTSRTVKVDGVSIHYHDAGSADEVLVMLHGGSPGASGWSNFGGNLPALAERFRVLLIDLPHFGKSDRPAGRYLDIDEYAGVVADTLDAIGIAKAHFLGTSMGGAVVMELAMTRPEKVGRIVLSCAAGSVPMFSPPFSEGTKPIIGYFQGDGPSKEKMEALIRTLVYDQSLVTPEVVDSHYRASVAIESSVVREFRGAGKFMNLWRSADKIPHKTLLIYGRDDRATSWDNSLVLLRLMPDADLHVFSRCGHWAQWERGAEFNRVVENFLTSPAT